MTMRFASERRRQHVITRLRQRVDPRRCRWSELCRAVEHSLVLLQELGSGRELGWITFRNRGVYVVWDNRDEEVVTVLNEDFEVVTRWKEQLARAAG